jgi:AcrR family transcriptional regulator
VARTNAPTLPRAADGRVPGRRGLATRQRLLDCVGETLATTPYRDIKVTDITKGAATSPATFYQYFVDIEAAVLAIADDTADEGAKLAEHLEGAQWRGTAGWESAQSLVDAVLEFWTTHQPVLRVVDLLTEEGDDRFRQVRVRMLNALTRALASCIEAYNGEVDAMAMAGALVSMLAHVAAHQTGFESWDIKMSQVREAMIRLVYWGVTGPKVPKH